MENLILFQQAFTLFLLGFASYGVYVLLKDAANKIKWTRERMRWDKQKEVCCVCTENKPVTKVTWSCGDQEHEENDQICQRCVDQGWYYKKRCKCDRSGWYGMHEGLKLYLSSWGHVVAAEDER